MEVCSCSRMTRWKANVLLMNLMFGEPDRERQEQFTFKLIAKNLSTACIYVYVPIIKITALYLNMLSFPRSTGRPNYRSCLAAHIWTTALPGNLI